MHFATLQFGVFFAVVFVLAWAARGQRLVRNGLLLGASVYFYAGWNPKLLALLVGITASAYIAGEVICTSRSRKVRAAAMTANTVSNLAVLAAFKYYDFFRENVEGLTGALGLSSHLPVLEILMPVGLSYLVFQSIAYVVDLHRGHGHRAKTPLDMALFMSFFPQVLIGPICRSRDLLPQIEREPPAGIPDLSRAVSLVASGLIKKVILATYLATHLVEDAFSGPASFSSLELWIAAYAYTIQIYLDFSGYTDLARGIALLIGFEIPDNFNHPYVATSIAEFWRRWHMTFSNWLRDYVFIPSGGSRVGTLRTWFNLMLVMWVTGIWHGAGWGFLIWGSIHGVALVAYKIVQDARRARGVDLKRLVSPLWWRVICWLYTFHFVVLARIFFRTPNLDIAGDYYGGLVAGTLLGRGVEWLVIAVTLLGLAMNFWGPEVRRRFIAWHEGLPPWGRPVAWTALGAAILLLQPADVAPYLYFSF